MDLKSRIKNPLYLFGLKDLRINFKSPLVVLVVFGAIVVVKILQIGVISNPFPKSNPSIQTHSNCTGITRRFLGVKPQWGFSKFISKKFLTDPSNGYLVEDNCVFGAEVSVVKKEAFAIECLSLKNFEIPYKRDWMIPNFSEIREFWKSEEFSAGGHKWAVQLYPKGRGDASGRHVSIFLYYYGSNTGTPSERVQARRTICIKNQLHDKHDKYTSTVWYVGSKDNWGFTTSMEIATINDPKKGFIVNDSCHLEVEISVKAVVQVSPLPIQK